MIVILGGSFVEHHTSYSYYFPFFVWQFCSRCLCSQPLYLSDISSLVLFFFLMVYGWMHYSQKPSDFRRLLWFYAIVQLRWLHWVLLLDFNLLDMLEFSLLLPRVLYWLSIGGSYIWTSPLLFCWIFQQLHFVQVYMIYAPLCWQ